MTKNKTLFKIFSVVFVIFLYVVIWPIVSAHIHSDEKEQAKKEFHDSTNKYLEESKLANRAKKVTPASSPAPNKIAAAPSPTVSPRLPPPRLDFVVTPSSTGRAGTKAKPGLSFAKTKLLFADIETSMGVISLKLLPNIAPHTVENFVNLAQGDIKNAYIEKNQMDGKPFYDGLQIFRVVNGFFIQTGDLANTGKSMSYSIATEANAQADEIGPGLAVMAQQSNITSGTQFFIALSSMAKLLGRTNVVFARVVRGLDVANKMAKVPVDFYDRPLKEIKINQIKIHQ